MVTRFPAVTVAGPISRHAWVIAGSCRRDCRKKRVLNQLEDEGMMFSDKTEKKKLLNASAIALRYILYINVYACCLTVKIPIKEMINISLAS